jgi:septal ring factor EnvC (AmiA/AmiB activator)
MLGATGLVIVVLVVLVAALVLRLRQYEPAAVDQLGRRLAEARTELAAAEERAVALRAELEEGDGVLAPLRAVRAELEEELDRARVTLERERAELAEVERALAEQRAQRAEVEAALRDAERRLALPASPEAPSRTAPAARVAGAPAAATAAGTAAGPAPSTLDLTALARRDDGAGIEAPIMTTGGAVRPTAPLPDDEPERTGPGGTGEEESR